MKQLKFMKTITLEGKPIWYKDCIYDVVGEGANAQGREIYKLFCEDLTLRGIDAILADKFFKIIEIEDKKEEKIEVKNDKKEFNTQSKNNKKNNKNNRKYGK